MRRTNTIVIMSDEHNRGVLGCYGDPIVKTPNLDKLAKRGVRFDSAYTNSPVCVSARASFATGRYPHQIGAWDSATPFDGSPRGWGGRLIDAGHDVVSIGKLHFRSTEDDNGFTEELAPMHVYKGVGWISSLLRNPPVPLTGAAGMAGEIGVGETNYTHYDRRITKLTCDWLAEAASNPSDKPWVLYVGLLAPHFPLIAPKEFYDLYEGVDIPPPRQYAESERPRHPVLDSLRKSSDYDDYFTDEKVRVARQAYYGLCSFLDHNIGQIMDALDANGLTEDTRIVYTTDHGDNLGHRGFWGKSVMYEDAVAVPMIVAGPDVPAGVEVKTPVSLVDLHPTITEFAGEALNEADGDLPGESLAKRFDTPEADREVFSEYHDWSSITGMFMLRNTRWKLVCYPGYPDQLFDMEQDPYEQTDLASNPEYHEVLADMKARLAEVADIEELNRQAFADQAEKIRDFGGPEAILKFEDLGFTPPPEEAAKEAQGELADPYEP